MGVAGCGKSSLAERLVAALDARSPNASSDDVPATRWRLVEADDFHPPANRDKMARGEPLDDDDRRLWLDRVAAEVQQAARDRSDRYAETHRAGVVLACSALKRRYRERLIDDQYARWLIVHLRIDRDTAARRIGDRSRRGAHFMPTSLVDSQFQALEPPDTDPGAAGEPPSASVLNLDATLPIETLVARVLDALEADRL